MKNKKGFDNILISFLRSWSHRLCSATIISEIKIELLVLLVALVFNIPSYKLT